MSAQALLHLLNKLGKAIKCKACRAFYRFFRNEINKFNNTGAQMLYSTYHMTFKLLNTRILALNCQYFAIFFATLNGRNYVTY